MSLAAEFHVPQVPRLLHTHRLAAEALKRRFNDIQMFEFEFLSLEL